MKRLLLTLVAALSLPTAVNAESVWLILRYSGSYTDSPVALEKIEMKDINQCEMQGATWLTSKRIGNKPKGYECLIGK